MVEIAFSTFKRILGEDISARVWCNVVREIKFSHDDIQFDG